MELQNAATFYIIKLIHLLFDQVSAILLIIFNVPSQKYDNRLPLVWLGSFGFGFP